MSYQEQGMTLLILVATSINFAASAWAIFLPDWLPPAPNEVAK
jgi:hypothetical protein